MISAQQFVDVQMSAEEEPTNTETSTGQTPAEEAESLHESEPL